jgi:hypothetical protein
VYQRAFNLIRFQFHFLVWQERVASMIWKQKKNCVFFLDPPGAPEVSGYIEGETIRLGQTLTLVCTAKGGNPLAEITWYRNGIKVFHYKIKIMVRNDNYFLFSLSCICVNTLFLSEKYEVTCMLNKIPLLKFSGWQFLYNLGSRVSEHLFVHGNDRGQ